MSNDEQEKFKALIQMHKSELRIFSGSEEYILEGEKNNISLDDFSFLCENFAKKSIIPFHKHGYLQFNGFKVIRVNALKLDLDSNYKTRSIFSIVVVPV